MKTLKQSYLIEAPVAKVWQALVDPQVIEAWSGAKAKMDDQVGSKFELWGGDIYGTNTEVVANEKLVQDWYGGDWHIPSKVTFILTAIDSKTQLDLIHDNLPDEEADNFDDGWKDYYLGPLKKLLEQ